MKGVLAILLCAAIGINAYPYDDIPNYKRTPLGDAIDKASLKLLKEAYKTSSDKNVVSSPLGVMMLLALYSEGAAAGTREEIHKVLGGYNPQKASYKDDYVQLSTELAKMDRSYLTLANKIYVQEGYALNSDFSKISKDFQSDLESINFKEPEKAAKTINKWSSDKTEGHIDSPLSPDAIDQDTVAGLFNVIFFKGHWHVPFNASETKDEKFYVTKENTVMKPTMHLTQSLYYTESETLGAKLVELPYKESGFRMVVVLPNEVDGLSSVIEKASEKGLLEDVFKLSPSGRDVNLHMPKFDIKTKLNLNDLLPKVGVNKMFSEGATGIVKDDTVVVSKAFQEAFVKVDEEGATAGAFTGVIMMFMSSLSKPPSAMDFKVDHPFMYLILHKDKVIFAGTYTQ